MRKFRENGQRTFAKILYILCIHVDKKTKKDMDIQDGQDNQDETLLHGKPTLAMIAWGFADFQEYRTADCQKKSCISCASMLIFSVNGETSHLPASGSTVGFALAWGLLPEGKATRL
ncbi:MAG: hypothetical protein OXI69_12285 [Acidobacteriota bacterium]|nr:hypothetical protein [Acidobacteriota bacterium]